MDDLSKKRALTITQTATYACVSRGTVKAWIDHYGLRYENLPGRGQGRYMFVRIRLADLDEFLDKHRVTTTPSNHTQPKPNDELVLLPRPGRRSGERSVDL